jgi:hypothetical protein
MDYFPYLHWLAFFPSCLLRFMPGIRYGLASRQMIPIQGCGAVGSFASERAVDCLRMTLVEPFCRARFGLLATFILYLSSLAGEE